MKSTAVREIFAQLIATAGAFVLINQTGIIDGWSSPNLARLTATNATIHLTSSEASWLASYLKLGRFVSVILVPVFIELSGTRKAILYSFVPVSAAWVLMMMATSAWYLFAARFLSGVTYGLAYGCHAMYLGEIAAPAHRGTLLAVASIGWPFGTIFSTVAETYFPGAVSSALYFLLCLLGMTVFMWLPDSPYQLVKNKDRTRARHSLAWFRGRSDTNEEMQEICEFVESTSRITFRERLRQLGSPVIWKAVVLVCLAFIYPQLCGLLNIVYYMQTILTNSKFRLVDSGQMVIYINVVLLVTAIVTINLVDKFGRRVLLVISSAIMTHSLLALSLHHYLLTNSDLDPASFQALPVAAIILLQVTFGVGYSPVVNALLSEMFPSDFKSTAATIVTLASACVGFVSTKAYQPLIDAFGETAVFLLYALLMATLIPVVVVLLPETKGRSLLGIQNVLNKP